MTQDPCRVVAKYLFGFAALVSVFGSLNPRTPTTERPKPVVITPTPQAPAAMIAHPPAVVATETAIVAEVVSPMPTPTVVATPTAAPQRVVLTPRPTAIRQAPAPAVSGTHEDWMRAAGIAESDFQYVDYIVVHESGWRVSASNPSSGAYGLCQSLPASKMASAGSDYLTNPVTQLRWCHQYAQSRYKGWYGSYQAWLQKHWW